MATIIVLTDIRIAASAGVRLSRHRGAQLGISVAQRGERRAYVIALASRRLLDGAPADELEKMRDHRRPGPLLRQLTLYATRQESP